MFEFWREATAASVPGLLCQSGRRRPERLYLKFPITFYLINGEKKAFDREHYSSKGKHFEFHLSEVHLSLCRVLFVLF